MARSATWRTGHDSTVVVRSPAVTDPDPRSSDNSGTGVRRSTAVVLYIIVGGGHTWPGADPRRAVGLTTQQVSATLGILSFFNLVRR